MGQEVLKIVNYQKTTKEVFNSAFSSEKINWLKNASVQKNEKLKEQENDMFTNINEEEQKDIKRANKLILKTIIGSFAVALIWVGVKCCNWKKAQLTLFKI